MDNNLLHTQRYPIGTFSRKDHYTPSERSAHISIIRDLPEALQQAIEGLSKVQLDTPYREGGWTLRQVVHHLADSHMNAFVRHRLALTEEQPTIKPYEESAWVRLPDAARGPVELSVGLLRGLHERWALMLESLSDAQWSRTFHHPDSGLWTLEQSIAQYAWHSKHHVAHITELRKRVNW